jgi:hypothetical protein
MQSRMLFSGKIALYLLHVRKSFEIVGLFPHCYFSFLISAPVAALDDELRELGVSRLSSGKKNESSQSLLAWYTGDKPKKSTAVNAPMPVAIDTVFKLQYQDEQVIAGAPSNRKVETLTKPPPYVKNVPYGIDSVLESPKRSGGQTKSLAEIMRSR